MLHPLLDNPVMDGVRHTLHKAIHGEALNGVGLVRGAKTVARGVNELLGSPIATRDELQQRREAAETLERARRNGPSQGSGPVVPREAAPVVVYLVQDRNVRELERIRQVLKGKNISFEERDVTDDESMQGFILTEAKVELEDLPVVYVGGDAVGTYRDLVTFDASGQLERAVFG